MATARNAASVALFNKELKNFLDVNEGKQRQILVKASLDTFTSLVERTPRKTGRARAGWIPTVDSGPAKGKPPEGKRTYAKPRFGQGAKIKAYSVIDLTNNVEYIEALDKGHSKQAPSGIINYVMARAAVFLARLVQIENQRRVT